MGFIDIIIMILVIALVVFTIIYNLRKAKTGGGCSSCHGCGSKSNCSSAKSHSK